MINKKLIIASAGAGKTKEIVDEAINRHGANQSVLILTYTQNNQMELLQRVACSLGAVPNNIRIKGWFSFLLEDLIRPYQQPFFEKRITNINFNDSNPHRVGKRGFQLPGRKEQDKNGNLNPKHFLTNSGDQAHTAFLSKLACRIAEDPATCSTRREGRRTIKTGFAFERLARIYNAIIVDEVQDLTGWDYLVIEKLCSLNCVDITCVGDFRQTIYLTHHDSKIPGTTAEKLAKFENLAFKRYDRFVSHRCNQTICDFADGIHAFLKLPPTKSLANKTDNEHVGVFAVRREHVKSYLEAFEPTFLRNRRNVETALCEGRLAYNFGEAKGLQFERTLILPTPRQQSYICGNDNAFNDLRTEQEINRFYVAATRAKLSAALIWEGTNLRHGIKVWNPL